MSTSPFFNNFVQRPEQELAADLIAESIKHRGYDFWYIPRTVVDRDDMLEEESLAVYNNAISIEMYIANVEGFDGDGDILGKFGVEIRDRTTLSLSKKTFETIIGGPENMIRPREGDLIWMPMARDMYEIRHVEHESVFFQLGDLPLYNLSCEKYEYSHEVFNTGVTEIDEAMNEFNQDTLDGDANPVDTFDDSDIFEAEADLIVDFTENNPFGEV